MTNKEAIKYLIVPTATSTKSSAEYLKQKEAYELAIKALEEKPQGEWIDQDFDDLKISDYRCNQCGHYQDDITNFCPNCGAKMSNSV